MLPREAASRVFTHGAGFAVAAVEVVSRTSAPFSFSFSFCLSRFTVQPHLKHSFRHP